MNLARAIATEALIFLSMVIVVTSDIAGHLLQDRTLDFMLGAIGIYAGHRSVKNVGEVIASRKEGVRIQAVTTNTVTPKVEP